jgi:hypothetical protein
VLRPSIQIELLPEMLGWLPGTVLRPWNQAAELPPSESCEFNLSLDIQYGYESFSDTIVAEIAADGQNFGCAYEQNS